MNPRKADVGDGAILMKLIRRLNPVRDSDRYTDAYWENVEKELRIHQGVAEGICVVGLILGLFLPLFVTGTYQGWDIGIGFGAMVVLPLTYQVVVCCGKGFRTTFQRWRDYSTMMHAIPWKAQFVWLYLPCLVLFAICIVGRTGVAKVILSH